LAFWGRASATDLNAPIKVVLHPMGEPCPALKYQLLPPLSERRPGNAAIHYLKVGYFSPTVFTRAEFWTTICKWAEMPLPELRKAAGEWKNGRNYDWVAWMQPVYDMLDRGACCESCDWDLLTRGQKSGDPNAADVLQRVRGFARILVARARLQVADGKFDEAIRTLRTGYAMARHVAQAPALINGLVGVTLADVMSKQLETLVQQPGAPNLYWALATLPQPLLDLRPGYEEDLAVVYLSYPELRDLDKKDYPADHWRQLLQQVVERQDQFWFWENWQRTAYHLGTVASMLEGYPRAKRFLIARGRSPAEVEAMPVPQVVLLYTMRNYDELRDDVFKWVSFPYGDPKARRGIEEAERKIRDYSSGREIIRFAEIEPPALEWLKRAEARMERDLAALKILEALRIYAAGHEGRLPGSLNEITEVPIPLDPLRGGPFVYRRQGDTAILESSFPPNDAYPLALHYEIQIAPEGAKP
jgi:hypothetical protein